MCLVRYRPFISMPCIALPLFHTSAFSYSLPAIKRIIPQRVLTISPCFVQKAWEPPSWGQV